MNVKGKPKYTLIFKRIISYLYFMLHRSTMSYLNRGKEGEVRRRKKTDFASSKFL